jgi:hypothetical protein
MTRDLTTTSILSLFETDKSQRESFCMDLINRIDSGEADPLKVHLQIKCMEDIIKLLNSNTVYKAALLEASEKMGQKSFEFHNAKFEIKETGVKYDFSKCGDVVWETLDSAGSTISDQIKEREKFLKTVPQKGMTVVNDQTGEVETIFPPSKSSTTSVAVTLK